MATIALALGMDARELFPALTSGATRADALLQHLKQRGKGPGQILQMTERMLNFKFLPPHLKAITDFMDDEQDRQTAEIRMIRSNKRVQDTTTGVVDERRMRELMVYDHDITEAQFEQLELESGRLQDGTPVLALFFKKDPRYKTFLDLGVENPLDYSQNDPQYMLDAIFDKRVQVYDVLANETNERDRWTAQECDRALTELEMKYMDLHEKEMQFQISMAEQVGRRDDQQDEEKPKDDDVNQQTLGLVGRPAKPGTKRIPGKKYIDPRIRSGGLMNLISSSNITEAGNR
jgi:hypothetical protein